MRRCGMSKKVAKIREFDAELKQVEDAMREIFAEKVRHVEAVATEESTFAVNTVRLNADLLAAQRILERAKAAKAPAPAAVEPDSDLEVRPIVAQPVPAAPEKKRSNALQEFWAGFSGR